MENLAQGSVRIFWGLFKKLLIADRLYLLVDVIFNNYQYHYGEMIVIVAIAYTTQLYMEFSGCMDIIIGSGKMFGVTLPENFRQPFFSKARRNSGEDGILRLVSGLKRMCFIRYLCLAL